MGRFLAAVMGPAGSGKSTLCRTLQDHAADNRRTIHVANMDPAAEGDLPYAADFDIRELICLEDAMTELNLGPNGGLVYCMEFLVENLTWLDAKLEAYDDDELVVLDMPGQVELYSHLPVMRNIMDYFRVAGFRLAGVHLIDALCATEAPKLISASLLALSCMLQLEVPHINVMTKCDLLPDKEGLEAALEADSAAALTNALGPELSRKLDGLTRALCGVVDEYMLVHYLPLDPTEEESVAMVLAHVDHVLQYGEEVEPREPREWEGDGDAEDPGEATGAGPVAESA